LSVQVDRALGNTVDNELSDSSSFRIVNVSFEPPSQSSVSTKRPRETAVTKRARRSKKESTSDDNDVDDAVVDDDDDEDTRVNFNRYVRPSDREFVCGKRSCKQASNSWDAFVSHQLSAHKIVVALCPFAGCERVFMSGSSLQLHWLRHGAQGLACPAADCARLEMFSTWRAYRDHCRQRHLPWSRTGVGDCVEGCGFVGKNMATMRLHVLQKHALSPTATSIT
jgi:hypothetical protein